MHFRQLFGIVAFSWLFGCDQRPINPAIEVMENPPEEVNTSTHSEVSISLNGLSAMGPAVTLKNGNGVHLDAKLVRTNSGVIPLTGMLLIRVLPEGASTKQWGSYEYVDEYICMPDPIAGTASLDATVKAPPGTYEYRGYALYHYAAEEKPELYLISKGKLIVSEATPFAK